MDTSKEGVVNFALEWLFLNRDLFGSPWLQLWVGSELLLAELLLGGWHVVFSYLELQSVVKVNISNQLLEKNWSLGYVDEAFFQKVVMLPKPWEVVMHKLPRTVLIPLVVSPNDLDGRLLHFLLGEVKVAIWHVVSVSL